VKILLVEDSKFLRLATGRALAHAGYEMSFAGDGDEALLMAGENLPNLILLDMMLPKMSGPDVLKGTEERTCNGSDSGSGADWTLANKLQPIAQRRSFRLSHKS
jgi:DNA-binding response OmpR family regulator